MRESKPIRTYKHRKTKGRSLTDVRQLDWLRKQRSEEIKEITINYNAQFDGKPIFFASQVVLLTFGMSVCQYLERELTDREYKQFFLKGGKYNNWRKVNA